MGIPTIRNRIGGEQNCIVFSFGKTTQSTRTTPTQSRRILTVL
uniref:Uncharacterized protein n=1 Tax=Siphoviridae sp. ctdHi7 TaxID=2825577 RepID=A0A8S5U1W0_9CAUD|nr:MAG TPA: hypothetical protein [Siphoviridae sp. ctdHi7]